MHSSNAKKNLEVRVLSFQFKTRTSFNHALFKDLTIFEIVEPTFFVVLDIQNILDDQKMFGLSKMFAEKYSRAKIFVGNPRINLSGE